MKEKLALDGSEAMRSNTPADFRSYFLKEIDKWAHFVKVTGIKLAE